TPFIESVGPFGYAQESVKPRLRNQMTTWSDGGETTGTGAIHGHHLPLRAFCGAHSPTGDGCATGHPRAGGRTPAIPQYRHACSEGTGGECSSRIDHHPLGPALLGICPDRQRSSPAGSLCSNPGLL